MVPQACHNLTPQTAFFHYEMSKSLEIFFQCWFFFANFGLTEAKNLLNSLAISCGFWIMLLSTLTSQGRRFDFVFCFSDSSFISCQVSLESILYLRSNFE